jgi:hypothetical protein
MSDIQDVMDVTFEELSTEQQLQLKEAIEQFQQKCLMSFSKIRSGVSFLKSDTARVLMQGEPDTTAAAEKQEVFGMVHKTLEDIMAKHNTAFFNSFRQMMARTRQRAARADSQEPRGVGAWGRRGLGRRAALGGVRRGRRGRPARGACNVAVQRRPGQTVLPVTSLKMIFSKILYISAPNFEYESCRSSYPLPLEQVCQL